MDSPLNVAPTKIGVRAHRPPPLDGYLDTICKQLRMLPREVRRQYREEIGQHLVSLIEERLAAGESRKSAILSAAHSFGDPKEVGRAIAAEFGWGSGIVPGSLKSAALCGVIWLAVMRLIVSAAIVELFRLVYRSPQLHVFGLTTSSISNSSLVIDLALSYVLVPWIAGWMTGQAAPRFAAKGMVIAAAVLNAVYITEDLFGGMPSSLAFWGYIPTPIARTLLWMAFGYWAASASSIRLRRVNAELTQKGALG